MFTGITFVCLLFGSGQVKHSVFIGASFALAVAGNGLMKVRVDQNNKGVS